MWKWNEPTLHTFQAEQNAKNRTIENKDNLQIYPVFNDLVIF